jgi:RND family efflux transporter MFP subunit
MNTFKNIFKSKIVISVLVLLVLIIGVYFLFFHHKTTYQFIPVASGSITETVSLTGNTTASQSVSLGFSSSGNVSNIYSALGKKVSAGQVLAELNTSDLSAQLHNAQAGLVIAQQQASTSENNLANVTTEQNTLVANAHNTLLNSTPAALNVGNYNGYDAPTVSGTYTCSQEGTYDLKTYSSSNGVSVNYTGLEQGSFLLTSVPRPMGACGLFLSFDPTKTLQAGAEFNVNIPNKNAPNYNANSDAYQLALQTRDKAIADAEANVSNDNASSSVVDAQIVQAQASVESAQAKLQNAEIIAPISGTVTQFDAKVGQFAPLSTPLVSIISNAGYEVDGGVSEIDIGKVSVGDTVSMTLDAFPNESFTGKVFYIAPAETNTNGVISYQIKIGFDKNDPRLKSGLTANIDIQTKHKDNVLILPQYAVLQNDQGTFVETLVNNKIVQNPVTLGIQDEKGNVEVVSGVTLGEQVLNIGLKS